MDTRSFVEALDSLFVGDPAQGRPRDPRFASIAADVEGFTTPGELAVLNLAARHLSADEAYLEVGTFKGRSLCGAALDSPAGRFFAVENYMEFGMTGALARGALADNVKRLASQIDLTLIEGDAFEVLAAADFDRPVGVYFYDGVHTGEAHHLALALVEPLLADEALVLIDDACWPMVERATLRFVASHPEWSVLRVFAAPADDDPGWANGLAILAYRRIGPRRSIARSDRARQAFQVRLRGPIHHLAWRVAYPALNRLPGLVPVVRRLVPTRSRTIH